MRVGEVVVGGLLVAAAAPGGTLTVDVAGVRNDRGTVHVDVCPQDRFLKEDCPFSGDAPARPGVTAVTVRGVPAGDWAVQAFHDENGNGKVDRGLFGIPKEGVGFSRDARILLGPPRWADAVFATAGGEDHIGLTLRYFLGSRSTPK